MKEAENSTLERLFKQEVLKALNKKSLDPLPKKLEVQPSAITNLDRWRKKK